MRRVLIYDRFDAQVCELSENDVFELTRHEVVNGAHELSITTTQVLEKGYRVLMEDDRGYWHEWVVSGIDELHANGSRPYGSYYCVWSLQPDLMGTRVSAMPGVQTPTTAALALDAALGGTSRWTRGTVTNTNTGGASMYDTDGWSAISTLVANWGGEVAASIGVSASKVVSRQVDLYAQQGESTAKRRFDFGADLVSVRRTIADDPLYCRITPRGMGELTEGGGYGRRITIESVNDGKDYLENASMVDLAKLPNGNGGWEYPTLEVENQECETPSELLAWAQSVLDAYTNPKVTYEVNVVQAAKEGIDLQGVSLGDEVQVVDGKFNDLRLTGRVMEMTIDELAHTTTQLTIGNAGEGISERFSDLYSGIKTAEESVTQLAQSLSTADYIDNLLDRINAEINATGGYAYIVPGNGILTFDVAVADPLNPVEASRVVEIKGGSIRIANSKTAQGQWEWKTVFTSGHISGELVTAAQITTGYIGSSGGTFIDLDSNTVQLGESTKSHIVVDDGGLTLYGKTPGSTSTSEEIAKFGYAGSSSTGEPKFTLGYRTSGSTEGEGSVSIGWSNTASGTESVAIGSNDEATGQNSFAVGMGCEATGIASIAIGSSCESTAGSAAAIGMGARASGTSSVALCSGTASGATSCAVNDATASSSLDFACNRATANGSSAFAANSSSATGVDSFSCGTGTASKQYSFAQGEGTQANVMRQAVFGMYNVIDTTNYLVIVGKGTSSARSNALYLNSSGKLWIASTLTQNSDRRLKQHVAYLGDDASIIINRLKPAVFIKDGGRHYGFYAQDVQQADIWDTKTVEAQHSDESLDFDPLSLDYTALIAPLTAYAQNLEKRVESLETRLSELEEKIGKE